MSLKDKSRFLDDTEVNNNKKRLQNENLALFNLVLNTGLRISEIEPFINQ
jgi:integrase